MTIHNVTIVKIEVMINRKFFMAYNVANQPRRFLASAGFALLCAAFNYLPQLLNAQRRTRDVNHCMTVRAHRNQLCYRIEFIFLSDF